MESFRATLPQLVVVASDSSSEETPVDPTSDHASLTPVEDHYAVIRADLMKNKMGALRKIISDQNLDLTTGGKKKEKVVEDIISCLKSRDGITEETSDEETK